ncbi:12870_t:CDS:2, partial [Racocetra fulgida]
VNSYDTQLKKECPSEFLLVEEVLERWLQYAFVRQMTLTDKVLLKKAKSIAFNIEEQNFYCLHRWLVRFKAWHRIKAYARVGESGSTPPETEINAECERFIENEQLDELNNLIAELPIDNLFNANEFIHLDDILQIEEMLDNMTLIEQIHHEHNGDDTQSDDEDEPLCKISLQEGTCLAKSLVKFLLQQNDEFGVSAEELGI